MHRLVIVETPYKNDDPAVQQGNIEFADACMLDSLKRGEAPFLSHLLYTRVLDDKVPEERKMGIEAGLAWGRVAQASVVYLDRGMSSGMVEGLNRAEYEARPIEYRWLDPEKANAQVLP